MYNPVLFLQKNISSTIEKIKPSHHETSFLFGKGNSYSISIARTLSDYKQCFNLVYESYFEKGLAGKDSEKLWYTIFNADPSAITIQVKKDKKVIGTLTLINDGELGLPADDLYQQEVDAARLTCGKISEVTSFAISPEFRGSSRVILKLTEFVIFIAKEIVRSEKLLITVHPHHANYYKNGLLFEQMGDEKSYEKVSGALAVLYGLDFSKVDKEVGGSSLGKKSKSSYRFHSLYLSRQSSINRIKRQMQSISLPLFTYFFIKRRGIFNKVSQDQAKYIQGCYKRKLIRFNPSIFL